MGIFDVDYAYSILGDLLWGFRINLMATALSFSIALTFGLVLELARRSTSGSARLLAKGYIGFVRSTPLLVQLFFLYFILPEYGVTFAALTVGVWALGLHYACYIAEVYRAGLGEVPRTQWEAAIALNFRTSEAWWRIILPQALPPIMPVLGNYFISLIKETPLLAAITVSEAMQRASILGARNYQYLEPVTLVGLMMLVSSLVLAALVRLLDAYIRSRTGEVHAKSH